VGWTASRAVDLERWSSPARRPSGTGAVLRRTNAYPTLPTLCDEQLVGTERNVTRFAAGVVGQSGPGSTCKWRGRGWWNSDHATRFSPLRRCVRRCARAPRGGRAGCAPQPLVPQTARSWRADSAPGTRRGPELRIPPSRVARNHCHGHRLRLRLRLRPGPPRSC
jgi:hypothetical protein